MQLSIYRFLISHWQRKIVAVIAALVVWLFVNHSIIETKILTNIPVKVINLPSNKTITGLLPNNILGKRITLTLSGTKDIVRELEAGDLEVVLDASMAQNDEWIVQITKKNLVSLNPSINLANHITQVEHADFVINLTQLITAKIPITIFAPTGDAPDGYIYLDVWPEQLTQTISGPKEEVEKLKEKGLKLVFDLNQINPSELDQLRSGASSQHNDEISYYVPTKWKQVSIPFRNGAKEEINDPDADFLHIEFLKKQYHGVDRELPIRVFYPMKYSDTINPLTYSLAIKNRVRERNGIALFSSPLYLHNVSRLFLDIVKENLEIFILAAPKSEREQLQWSVEVIDAHDLEDTYVAMQLTNSTATKNLTHNFAKRKEMMLRKRFRDFMQRLRLYTAPSQKLFIESYLEGDKIIVI